MALGLPEHLARDALRRAVQRAAHAAAAVCLLAATIVALASAIARDRPDAWYAVAAFVAMAAALAFVALRPSVTSTLLYLAVGAATVFLATLIVMSGDSPFASSNNVVLAMPRVALVLVGGAGVTTAAGITWAVVGFALGELAAFAGSELLGTEWRLNTAAMFALAVIVSVLLFDRAGRRSASDSASGVAAPDTELLRASRQTRELALRHDRELRATARLHDTALTHLVAIASAGSGPVDDRLRASIRQDLALVVGRDWVLDQPEASTARPGLDQARAAADLAGVEVRMTGDAGALALVTPERAEALDAAVAQSLVNVGRHAGVDVAEVAIGVGGGELTIAVMDTGAGFDEREVPPDRIGLRTSIRGRIEGVGGTVRLWSTKGVGTTIVLTVPTEPER
jgi:signal transduction histidine kinase